MVSSESPVDKPSITSDDEFSRVEDVGLVSFGEAHPNVEFVVIVDSTLKVNYGILVMIDDDVLVRVLELQLSDHSLGELILNSVLIIAEVGDSLGQATDETKAGPRDHCDTSAL